MVKRIEQLEEEMKSYYQRDGITIYHGDCGEVMEWMGRMPVKRFRFSTVITDPPYGLEFMGKGWDRGTPGVPFYTAMLDIVLPGGVALIYGGTRTHHRMMCAVEDAGWEIRDCLMWLYGSGFPKSYDISKGMDKAAGVEREIIGQYQPPAMNKPWNLTRAKDKRTVEVFASSRNNLSITAPATPDAQLWNGYGTALKPAWEPILLAMKPRDGTFVNNAMEYGVAGLNVDGGRIGTDETIANHARSAESAISKGIYGDSKAQKTHQTSGQQLGRWPANLLLDEEVASELGDKSRYFYCAKASRKERDFGLDGTLTTKYNIPNDSTGGISCQDVCMAAVTLLRRATSELEVKWLIGESGESIMALCPEGSLSTISTGINKIIESKTFPSLMHSLTNESTADVSSSMENGGSRVESVEGLRKFLLTTTSGKTELALGASRAALETLLKTREKDAWQQWHNTHSTVKPISLLEYLCNLTKMPTDADRVLDPFLGSGSTLVACVRTGRPGIGIEMNEEYCEIAARRTDAEFENVRPMR